MPGTDASPTDTTADAAAPREQAAPPEQGAPPGQEAPGEQAAPAAPRAQRHSLDTPTPLPLPTPAEAHERYERIFAGVGAPFAFLDLDAVWSNAADMLRRAQGKPIRIASKSVRCLPVLERLLDLDRGFQGVLSFTLPEALWLWERGQRDLLLAYPTADAASLTRLARITAEHPEEAPIVTVDCAEHLDLIEAAAASFVAPIRVAIDIDLSWRPLGGPLKVGPKRSPVRSAVEATALAREIERRDRVRLVGLMAYEGQIAGVPDDVPGRPARNLAVRAMQAASARDVAERRAEIVTAVSEVAELELVNGGGTGSIEQTAREWAVTEVAAGSGFYAPALFDHYSAFSLNPAAFFALPVVRKPGQGIATTLGGGYLASGAGARDRMPVPHLPDGLRLDPREGAGEVQTPVLGAAADRLSLGDRVYFRHAKAGELCERFDRLYLVAGSTIREEVPTYRGAGRTFL